MPTEQQPVADAYDHRSIEAKWSQRWQDLGCFTTNLQAATRPYYNLMMFPYPSAEGLHVGNVFAFVGSDIYGRLMRARGYDVFEPFGFDAFGIHSENYAIKTGGHPGTLVPRNIANFRRQLRQLGMMFDWSHEVNTTDPAYYRWTQWIFVQLFKAGLAYQKDAAVNWCPSCRTVLAAEQAEGGSCERCHSPVEQRQMRQWFFRITAYAGRLLKNLDWIDWSDITRNAQRGWIGRTDAPDGEPVYHLRDWCISRQRYWGPPIPIVHCDHCGSVPVPEDQLPVMLPYTEDFQADGSGASPLARVSDFLQTTCPQCASPARRETDVSDNFLDSAWYFLRYPSSDRSDAPFDSALTRKWLPVDMYIGGNEHAVLHLMYTRFITMVLHDMGLVDFDEPFKRFRAHGIITRDGGKMSKSRPEQMINPDAYVDRYGADTFRTYLMFMGPYTLGGDFQDGGISGIRRFLERVWRYVTQTTFDGAPLDDAALLSIMHEKIRKVTRDIEDLHYNTAISALMELLTALQDQPRHHRGGAGVLLQMLSPFAPFMAQELWARLGAPGMVHDAPWPAFDESLIRADDVEIVIQVDGKRRGTIRLSAGASQEEVEQAARTSRAAQPSLLDRQVVRTIFVPDRLINLVTGSIAGR
jgi:leucyl-tRNA synthetase